MNNKNPDSDLSLYAPPSFVVDQITFRSSQSENQVMFVSQSGKLSYGRGTASLIFSHFNFLGRLSDGRRNEKNGDSFFLFPVM